MDTGLQAAVVITGLSLLLAAAFVREDVKMLRPRRMTKAFSPLMATAVLLSTAVFLSACEWPAPKPDGLKDSDGDGVPDQLEINGYFWKDGEFRQWNGDPNVTYYRTDPTQSSTDQDPYSDGMEVSGIRMDASVAEPGNHPLVPAYPDVYVSMLGFDVQTKADITNSSGGKTQHAWGNATTAERSTEHHWDLSVEISSETSGGLLSGIGQKGSVKVTASGGGKYGSKNSITRSTSGFRDEDWQEATTTNPAEAAILKLRLRFENRGTAAAQNVVPTVNIVLGDKTINTYHAQEDKRIDLLAVNQRFPAVGEWVVGDRPKTLAGKDEIILTLDELRSIQLGVPLFLDVPQMDAEVVEQNEAGHWEAVDTWQNYKARIDGVCARITVDLGHGKLKSYPVFAKSANGPSVTLRDALSWTVGYEDTTEGVEIMGAPVTNWRIGFSENAKASISRQLASQPDKTVFDLVIDKGWTISIKAPSGQDVPEIVWVNASRETDGTLITAAVTDDYAVSKVLFKTTPDAPGQEMELGQERAGIYRILLRDFSPSGQEVIEAINDRERSATKPVHLPRKAPIADGIHAITSATSNKSLSLQRPAVGANVVQDQYYGYDTQQWSMQHVGSGDYRITSNGIPEACLEVVESKMTNRANVQVNRCRDADNQKWGLEPAGDGRYKLVARHSGGCLDVFRESAVQSTGSDSDCLQWIVQPASSYPARWPTTVDEDLIVLSKVLSKEHTPRCVTADTDRTLAALEWNGLPSQRWRFVPAGEGYFRICARSSSECLTGRQDRVVSEEYVAGDGQKWRLKRHETLKESDSPDFYYEIDNRQTGMSLTATASGLLETQYVGGEDQKWQLKPAEESWVGSIDVTINGKQPSGEGWVKVNAGRGAVDLNRGCGGNTDYIWLWVRGVNWFNIFVSVGEGTNKAEESCPKEKGWVQTGPNLNRGTRWTKHCNSLFLWVRGPAKDNIHVSVGKGTDKMENSCPKEKGWKQIGPDLNADAGGNFLYLWVR